MHGSARDIEINRTRAHPIDRAAWAVALNKTAHIRHIWVTLLALTVVDDVIRVSGMVRVARGLDVTLANVPTLTLATLDGPPLGLVGANVLPNGRWVWVSWTFERPANVCTEFAARIDHIDLANRAGGLVREAQVGPWAFTFRIPTQSRPAGPSERAGYGGVA